MIKNVNIAALHVLKVAYIVLYVQNCQEASHPRWWLLWCMWRPKTMFEDRMGSWAHKATPRVKGTTTQPGCLWSSYTFLFVSLYQSLCWFCVSVVSLHLLVLVLDPCLVVLCLILAILCQFVAAVSLFVVFWIQVSKLYCLSQSDRKLSRFRGSQTTSTHKKAHIKLH